MTEVRDELALTLRRLYVEAREGATTADKAVAGLKAVYWAGVRVGAGETPTPDEWSAAMDVERVRQIEHGYDDEHDRKHGLRHIINWAIDYIRRGKTIEAATMLRSGLRIVDALAAQVDLESGDSERSTS